MATFLSKLKELLSAGSDSEPRARGSTAEEPSTGGESEPRARGSTGEEQPVPVTVMDDDPMGELEWDDATAESRYVKLPTWEQFLIDLERVASVTGVALAEYFRGIEDRWTLTNTLRSTPPAVPHRALDEYEALLLTLLEGLPTPMGDIDLEVENMVVGPIST